MNDTITKMELTNRGFMRGTFKDRYGKECSIQKSSLATEPAIWLGCNEGDHIDGDCLARMHLTQEMAAKLIVLLQYFVDYGELPHPAKVTVLGDETRQE